jgi:hypothetical protein
MIGRTVSHFRVIEKLGSAGADFVVDRCADIRLARNSAAGACVSTAPAFEIRKVSGCADRL